MDKIYSFNQESCAYEEIRKPFIMHNLMLLALMFTSIVFFLLTCYYHAQNQITLGLAPGIAKNCYIEVDSLKMELVKQKQQVQLLANLQYMMKNAKLNESEKIPVSNKNSNSNLVLIPNSPKIEEYAYAE